MLVCVILLLAVPFRWEKGPQQTIGDSSGKATIIYRTDRWTDDKWMQIYQTTNDSATAKFVPVEVENLYLKGYPSRPIERWKPTELWDTPYNQKTKNKAAIPALGEIDFQDEYKIDPWSLTYKQAKQWEEKLEKLDHQELAQWEKQVAQHRAAIKNLQASYSSRRKTATGLWVALFVSSSFATVLLYRKGSTRNKGKAFKEVRFGEKLS